VELTHLVLAPDEGAAVERVVGGGGGVGLPTPRALTRSPGTLSRRERG
jgi:hypothetical protein